MADGLQHGGPFEAAAAFAHDGEGDAPAGGGVFGMDAGEPPAEGLIVVELRQLPFGTEGAGRAVDDRGYGGAQRLQVFVRKQAGFV